MKVLLTRRAESQIEKIAAWWKRHRPSVPTAVILDLERALALISSTPDIGQTVNDAALHGVRRLHLSRIHYFLYYRVKHDEVEVLALLHTSRRAHPLR